jgi:hypothetical protein
MSKIKSNSRALPGFRAIASLDQAKIHYQMSGRQDSVSDAIRLIIPQLMMENPGPCVWSGGDTIICYGDEGGGEEGPGAAKASCLSGDGAKLCHCSGNCFATQYTCYCTK